jgi:2-amino-4-hydroxy-6-hydroxymethyldihydropteridine diphosphokinase
MRAFVGVGSNLGDRFGHLCFAARALRAAGVAVVRASSVWDSAPLGPPQPRYLNAVLELETTLTPERLHALLHAIERRRLRLRRVRWGPRTLDLDLLLFGELRRRSAALTLPHPELAKRRFVLEPLAELGPDREVPGTGATVAALRDALPPEDLVRIGRYPL